MNRVVSLILMLLLYFILAISLIYTGLDVWPDEVYIADISRNFLSEGRFFTDLWGDTIPYAKNIVLWYPPVEFIILAGVYSIFGFSLESTRLTSIILGGFSVLFFYLLSFELLSRFSRIAKGTLNVLASVLTTAFLTDYRILTASTLGRPEIYTIFFGLASILLLIYSAKFSKFQKLLLLLGGLSSGLSFLTHFSGAIFAISAAVFYFYMKNYSIKKIRDANSALFALGFIIPISLWLIFMRGEFEIFWEQMRLQMDFRNLLSPSLPAIFNFRNEFIIVLKKIILLITLVLSIYLPVYTNSLKKAAPFILALGLAWYVNMSGKLSWYYVYIAVAVLMFAPIKIIELFEGNRVWKKAFVFAVMVLVISVNLLIFASNPNGFFNFSHNYYDFSKEVEKYVKNPSVVYTSLSPDPYFYLSGKGVDFILFPGLVTGEQQFLDHISNADYILKNDQIGIFSQLKNYVEYATENYEISKEIKAGGYYARLYKRKN